VGGLGDERMEEEGWEKSRRRVGEEQENGRRSVGERSGCRGER